MDWFSECDRMMKTEQRQILFMIDNGPSHIITVSSRNNCAVSSMTLVNILHNDCLGPSDCYHDSQLAKQESLRRSRYPMMTFNMSPLEQLISLAVAALNIYPALAMTGDDLPAGGSPTELFPDLSDEIILTRRTNQPESQDDCNVDQTDDILEPIRTHSDVD